MTLPGQQLLLNSLNFQPETMISITCIEKEIVSNPWYCTDLHPLTHCKCPSVWYTSKKNVLKQSFYIPTHIYLNILRVKMVSCFLSPNETSLSWLEKTCSKSFPTQFPGFKIQKRSTSPTGGFIPGTNQPLWTRHAKRTAPETKPRSNSL